MHEGWSDFYFLIGSGAVGLIGLLFVVVTLTAGASSSITERGTNLFMTPTVFLFSIVLTNCAFFTTARLDQTTQGWLVGAVALAALVFTTPRAIQLRDPRETQHWTDFWCYGVWPMLGYVAMAASAIGLALHATWPSTVLPLLMLALLLLGIRNAWDLLTWIAPRAEKLARGEIKPGREDAKP